MGLLDDYSGEGGLLGIGMTPRPAFEHQILLKNLLIRLDKSIGSKYFVLSESCVDLNKLNSVAPDVIVYDKGLRPVMFIEITNKKEMKKLEKKIIETMDQYNITEAFMYVYDINLWKKFSAIENRTASVTYSDVLKVDLAPFVKTNGQ